MKSIFTNVQLEHLTSKELEQRKLKASPIPEENELQKMLQNTPSMPSNTSIIDDLKIRGTCRTKTYQKGVGYV